LSYSKVTVFPFHAKQAQTGGWGIALPTLDPDTRKGWVISATLEPLYSLRRETMPVLQEAAWASGPEIFATTWVRSPDHSSRSESLHRLRYPNKSYIVQ